MSTRFRHVDPTPLASLQLDIAALTHSVLALRREQMEEDIKTLDLQVRINRLQGALSDLTQRYELATARRARNDNAGTPVQEVPA